MQIQIHGQHITVTDAIRNHVEERAEGEFGTFSDHIGKVVVHLEDINGPKGGPDKQCRVEVAVSHCSPVFAEETDADMYASITKAIQKAGRAVSKHFEKKKDH